MIADLGEARRVRAVHELCHLQERVYFHDNRTGIRKVFRTETSSVALRVGDK
jgi:hypothetical protein